MVETKTSRIRYISDDSFQSELELDERLVARLNNTSHTLYDEMASLVGLPRSQVKSAAKKGALWLARPGSKPRRTRRQLRARVGDRYYFNYNPSVLAQSVAPPRLVEDCGDYSVWDKPAGMLSQASKWSDHTSICRAVESSLGDGRVAYLVHRLDKMTSGVMLLSHKQSVTRSLAEAFQSREVRKTYQCIVLEEDFGQFPLVVDSAVNGKRAVSTLTHREKPLKWLNSAEKPNKSVLNADKRLDRCSLVTVEISTGRKHQVREHMRFLGAPIIGDRHRFNDVKGVFRDCDLQLRSVELAINCPLSGIQRYWDIR